jgi:AraC-like DNA-binding protein
MASFLEARNIPAGATEICESLTLYRFDAPAAPARYRWEALSACLVWQGAGRAQVEGRRYVCSAGSYIVKAWAPNGFETEILEASEDSPFLAALIGYTTDEVADAVEEMRRVLPVSNAERRVDGPSVYVRRITAEMRQLVTSLGALALSPSCLENTLLFRLRRRELLYSLLSPLFDTSATAGDPSAGPGFPHASDLQAAIELLSNDLASPLRVAELARAVNMSPSRFAHVFKEATGVSPHRFRKQLRLERAKFLLDEENWSVTAVATEVGYTNVSHFISEFKRIFGRTPGSIAGKP